MPPFGKSQFEKGQQRMLIRQNELLQTNSYLYKSHDCQHFHIASCVHVVCKGPGACVKKLWFFWHRG